VRGKAGKKNEGGRGVGPVWEEGGEEEGRRREGCREGTVKCGGEGERKIGGGKLVNSGEEKEGRWEGEAIGEEDRVGVERVGRGRSIGRNERLEEGMGVGGCSCKERKNKGKRSKRESW